MSLSFVCTLRVTCREQECFIKTKGVKKTTFDVSLSTRVSLRPQLSDCCFLTQLYENKYERSPVNVSLENTRLA